MPAGYSIQVFNSLSVLNETDKRAEICERLPRTARWKRFVAA